MIHTAALKPMKASDRMGQEDLARLQEIVGRVVTRAEGDSGRAKTLLLAVAIKHLHHLQ
jgi:hypothetical protein